MKVSSRGSYGIRLLVDLAENSYETHVSLAGAAKRMKISIRYLEQVAAILRRAGFIRSVKGASGGYMLAKAPRDIIIGDVLRALEGDMLVAEPPLKESQETMLRRCIRAHVYAELNERIAGVIDRQTLSSLMSTSETVNAYMYFI